MTAEDKLRETYFLRGIILLRQAIGEAKTIALIRSDVDVRYATWIELMSSSDEATLEALSYILTGLGLDPDELATQPVGLL